MKRRMRRLLPSDGRLFIVAMDHTAFLDAPVPALARYGATCAEAVAGGADAFLVPIGSAALYAEQIGPAALVASTPTNPPYGEYVVERALALRVDDLEGAQEIALAHLMARQDGGRFGASLQKHQNHVPRGRTPRPAALGRPLGLAQDARKTAHHRVHSPSVSVVRA